MIKVMVILHYLLWTKQTNTHLTGVRDDVSGQIYPTGITTVGGTGAVLIPLSDSGVGRVLDVKITNYGLEYTSAPKVTFNRKLIVKNETGNFTIGDEQHSLVQL